jgi:hypothetical protein
MTADRRAAEALTPEQIASDDGPLETSWTHSSCGYGCCGGGKEIDREALAALIRAYGAQCRAEALTEEHERLAKSAKE